MEPVRVSTCPVMLVSKITIAEHMLTLYIVNITLVYQRGNATISHPNHTSATKLTS